MWLLLRESAMSRLGAADPFEAAPSRLLYAQAGRNPAACAGPPANGYSGVSGELAGELCGKMRRSLPARWCALWRVLAAIGPRDFTGRNDEAVAAGFVADRGLDESSGWTTSLSCRAENG